MSLVCIIGLIVGIAGVSSANGSNGGYHPGSIVKASMGIFIAVFVIYHLVACWLYLQLRYTMLVFQKKLFLALGLSCPFVLVRIVYAAISDFADIPSFSLGGNPTIYLCMDVLEEIIAMGITMALAMSAVLEPDFVKLPAPSSNRDPKIDEV